jgi:hypothetical protein
LRGGLEPQADGGQVGGLAENDLAAAGVCGDGVVYRACAVTCERPLDLPELRRQAALVGVPDQRGDDRRAARRLELALGLALAGHEDLDDERLVLLAAPCLQRGELRQLLFAHGRLVVRPVFDENLHEGAGERERKGVGGPGQREGAGPLGGRADVDACAQSIGDDVRSVLFVDQQGAEVACRG